MTYPPPYEPPSNDPLRKHDPDAGDQGPPPADPGFAPPNYDYGYQQPGYPQPGYQQPAYQQQPPYVGGGMYGAPPPAETNSNAIIALVCGIGAFVICGLGAIPAIIFGNKALAEIEASGGRQEGRGMAQAGRIIGWVAVAMWAIGIILFIILIAAAAGSSST